MEADNFGLFWNNDIDLSDVLTVSVGIRYTDESKTAQIITTPIVAGPMQKGRIIGAELQYRMQ
jgi:hypothetical protein